VITSKELTSIAKARLKDAEALLAARRYDGAIYLCGYAIELALKARICITLGWQGYPSTTGEFRDYQSFRTHSLDVLLRLSGREKKIKLNFLAEWSAVAEWDPSARYKAVGTANSSDATLMISGVKKLLGKI
jgi:HEPN domain-containing protein